MRVMQAERVRLAAGIEIRLVSDRARGIGRFNGASHGGELRVRGGVKLLSPAVEYLILQTPEDDRGMVAIPRDGGHEMIGIVVPEVRVAEPVGRGVAPHRRFLHHEEA